jgi:uncharacterized membrane protein
MNTILVKCKPKNFLTVILFLQLTVFVTVFFDIPVARQVICFVYFTFIPGLIFLKILKMDKLDGVETILFSAGLSVAFLMIAGLFINEFCFLLGVSQPLSLLPLMIILNGILFVVAVLAHLKSENVEIWNSRPTGLTPFTLLFLCLPVLSIVGAFLVNIYGKNFLLLFMIMAISSLFVISIISTKLLPPKLYPFALSMIAIALLFHSALISNYIVTWGSDVPVEYFLFKTTSNNAHWSSTSQLIWDQAYGRMNAMLSVTILPTIYSCLLNLDPAWVFKVIFLLLFSLIPLGLYQIWQTYINKKYAFIATFLFMSQSTFYTEMLALNRQMVAELFFVLSLLVILDKKMKPINRIICFMIFSSALIMSHYALAEIFLFFIFFSLVFLLVLKRPSKNSTVGMLVFFFVAMFSWYLYTSNSAVFDSFVSFGNNVYRQLGEFLNPASRGQTVLRGLGIEESPSIWNVISRMFAYATQGLIVVGFVGLISKRVKIHFEKEYIIFSSAAMVILAALLIIPGLANTLNMTRFYHILLFLLAPFCIIGADVIIKMVTKREVRTSILILIVLIPYFLFQTNFVYEVARSDSWSLPLSKYRMSPIQLYGQFGYIDAYSVFGAQWVSKEVNLENSPLYADAVSSDYVLTIYGMIYKGNINRLSNVTIVEKNGIVYLSTLNVIHETIVSVGDLWNSSELAFLDNMNKIYSNGQCEILQQYG